MSLVSVIIPCFNAARFLRETVESVLVQTCPNFELIIVDDGSTDGTADVIRSFGTAVRSVSGPNLGVSAARNTGTELARGEFIQYLDADDLLAAHALSTRYSALQQSGADVAYSDWQRLVEDGSGRFVNADVVSRTIESVHRDPVLATATNFWSPPAALLYRRSIVHRIGGWNPTLPVIQDARFLQDAAQHGAKFVHVPGVAAYYRVHRDSSVSRRSRRAFLNDQVENALQLEQVWRGCGVFSGKHSEVLVDILSGVLRGAYVEDRALFEKVFAELNRIQPGWCPRRPWKLAVLSRLIGYRRAEAVAEWSRRAKAFFPGS